MSRPVQRSGVLDGQDRAVLGQTGEDAVTMGGQNRLGRDPVIVPEAVRGLGSRPGAGRLRDTGLRPRREGLDEDREPTIEATITQVHGAEFVF